MAESLNKQNDYFLNQIANPSFTSYDFQGIGLDATNTSFRSKEDYLKINKIKDNPLFKDDNGKFSQRKFDAVYNAAAVGYNNLANETTQQEVLDTAKYFRANIFVDPSKRENKYETVIAKVNNPMQQAIGFEGTNVVSSPLRSARENAERNSIWDPETQTYIDSPNDRGFFKNAMDPLIMAQYDEDEDINGKKKGEEGFDPNNIVHFKGEKKIDPSTGTYYYERLNGRSIVGKEVLSAWNTLTVDGSFANKFDPFDNDDIDQSGWSSLGKAVLKVAPLLIPGVGEYYAGIRVAIALGQLAPKVTKAFVGTDNSTVNQLEAVGATLNTDMSDYAQGSTPGTAYKQVAHPWGLESMLKMGADVFTQLAEQRFVFKYAPALVKDGSIAYDVKKQKAFEKAEALRIKQSIMGNLEQEGFQKHIIKQAEKYGIDLKTSMNKSKFDLETMSKMGASFALNDKLQSYQKIGANLSKIYMTGITVADTYNIAKQEGATDNEAALLALVHTGFEWKVLNLGISEQMLPELRMNKVRVKQAISEWVKTQKKQPAASAAQEVKESWLKNTIDKAQKLFKGDYHVRINDENGVSRTSAVLGQSLAAALGEGTEEVVEEVALDASKALGNLYYWLNGKDTRLSSFDYRDGEFHWGDTLNRYALNFIGGAIGGSLGNLKLNIEGANSINKITSDEALGIIVDEIRKGNSQELLNTADKMIFGDKYLSVTKDPIKVDDKIVFQQGNSTDNENATKHKMFNEYVQKVKEVLDENNMTVDNDSLLAQLSTDKQKKYLKELRALQLSKSEVSKNYIQHFNSICKDLIDNYTATMENENKFKDDSSRSKASRENSQEWQNYVKKQKELQKQKEELLKERDSYFDGTKSQEFIGASLFELNDFISGPWVTSKYLQYVVSKVGEDNISKLSDEQWNNYKDEWRNILESDKYNDILKRYYVFREINKKFSDTIKDFANKHFNMSEKDTNVIQSIEQLFSNMDDKIDSDIPVSSKMEQVLQSKTPDQLITLAQNFEISNLMSPLSHKYDIIATLAQLVRNQQQEQAYSTKQDNTETIGNLSFRLTQLQDLPKLLNKALHELEVKTNYDLDNTTDIGDRDYTNFDPRQQFVDLYNQAFNSTQGDNIATVVEDKVKSEKNSNNYTEQQLKDINDKLQHAQTEIYKNLNALFQNEFNKASKELFNNPEFIQRLKNEISKLNHIKYYTKETILKEVLEPRRDITGVKDVIDELNKVQTSPIEDFLDTFATTQLNLKNLHIKELLTKLRNFMRESAIPQEDLSRFQLTKQEEEALENIENVAQLLSTNILAARTDALEFGNLLGYNSMINTISGNTELATITNDQAMLILQDLAKIINTINYYRGIYQASSAKKLIEQDILSNKIDYGVFEIIDRLHVNIPDDWDGKSEFITELTNIKNRIQNFNEKDTSVKNQTLITQAKIDLLEAYGNLLRKNRNKDLSKLLNPIVEQTLESNDSKIDNNFKKFDTRTFIWLSAAADAMSAHAFYNLYKQTLDPDSIYIPNPGQELSVFVSNAKLLDGEVFARWIGEYNKSVTNWLRCTTKEELERKYKFLGEYSADVINVNPKETFNIGSKEFKYDKDLDDKYNENYQGTEFHISNKYSILIEGIPGCGKSTGFQAKLLDMIKLQPELKPLLSNVAVISAQKSIAQSILDSNNLTGKVYTVQEFFKDKFLNWEQKFNDNGQLNLDGKTISADPKTSVAFDNSVSINESAEKPSLIIFDECTRMSELDNYWLDKYQQENKIHGIFTGDYQQIGTMYSSRANGKTIVYTLNRNKFCGIQKLGISMRSNNNLKEQNLNILSSEYDNFIKDPENENIELSYYENDDQNSDTYGLFGDRIIDGQSYSKYESTIQTMLNSLQDGEVITYIRVTDDGSDTDLSKAIESLKQQYPDKIQTQTAMSSQGTEGQYYILEYTAETGDIYRIKQVAEYYYKTLYTTISRAKQGSLVVFNGDSSAYGIESKKVSSISRQNLSKEAIKKYTETKLQVFNGLKLNDTSKLVYTPIDDTNPKPKPKPAPSPGTTTEEDDDEDPENNPTNNDSRTKGIVKIKNDGQEFSMLFHTALAHELGLSFATEEYKKGTSNRLDITQLESQGYFKNGFTINYNDVTDENTTIGKMIKNGIYIQFLQHSTFDTTSKQKYSALLDFSGIFNIDKQQLSQKNSSPIISIKITDSNALAIYNYIKAVYSIRNAAHYATSQTDFIQKFVDSINNCCTNTLDSNKLGIKTFYIHKDPKKSNTRLPSLGDNQIFDLFADTNNYEGNGYYVVVYDKDTNNPIYATKMYDHTSPITMFNMDGFNDTYQDSSNNNITIWNAYIQNVTKLKSTGKSEGQAITESLKYVRDTVLPQIKTQLGEANTNKLTLAINVYLNSQNAFKERFGAIELDSNLFFNQDKKLTGILISTDAKGVQNNTYIKSGLSFDGHPRSIMSQLNIPGRVFSSKVQISTKSLYYGGDKSSPAILAGKPFVFVSDKSDTLESELADRFMEELKSKDGPKTVSVIYLNPPSSTLKQYLYNLASVYQTFDDAFNDKPNSDFGNYMTLFRMLDILSKDDTLGQLSGYKESWNIVQNFFKNLRADSKYYNSSTGEWNTEEILKLQKENKVFTTVNGNKQTRFNNGSLTINGKTLDQLFQYVDTNGDTKSLGSESSTVKSILQGIFVQVLLQDTPQITRQAQGTLRLAAGCFNDNIELDPSKIKDYYTSAQSKLSTKGATIQVPNDTQIQQIIDNFNKKYNYIYNKLKTSGQFGSDVTIYYRTKYDKNSKSNYSYTDPFTQETGQFIDAEQSSNNNELKLDYGYFELNGKLVSTAMVMDDVTDILNAINDGFQKPLNNDSFDYYNTNTKGGGKGSGNIKIEDFIKNFNTIDPTADKELYNKITSIISNIQTGTLGESEGRIQLLQTILDSDRNFTVKDKKITIGNKITNKIFENKTNDLISYGYAVVTGSKLQFKTIEYKINNNGTSESEYFMIQDTDNNQLIIYNGNTYIVKTTNNTITNIYNYDNSSKDFEQLDIDDNTQIVQELNQFISNKNILNSNINVKDILNSNPGINIYNFVKPVKQNNGWFKEGVRYNDTSQSNSEVYMTQQEADKINQILSDLIKNSDQADLLSRMLVNEWEVTDFIDDYNTDKDKFATVKSEDEIRYIYNIFKSLLDGIDPIDPESGYKEILQNYIKC